MSSSKASDPLKIAVSNSQTSLRLSPRSVREVVSYLLNRTRIRFNEVSIRFVTKKKIASLHEMLFGDPSPTDCITQPIDPPGLDGYCHLGEVFICPEVAIEFCKGRDKDPYQEVTLYLVHCLLHLLGYDDTDPVARKRMRQAERRWLSYLKQANLGLIG